MQKTLQAEDILVSIFASDQPKTQGPPNIDRSIPKPLRPWTIKPIYLLHTRDLRGIWQPLPDSLLQLIHKIHEIEHAQQMCNTPLKPLCSTQDVILLSLLSAQAEALKWIPTSTSRQASTGVVYTLSSSSPRSSHSSRYFSQMYITARKCLTTRSIVRVLFCVISLSLWALRYCRFVCMRYATFLS